MHCSLVNKNTITDHLVELVFTKPQDFSFKAGHFIRIKLPETEHTRAYSIASSPSDPFLKFLITPVQNGLLSPRLTSLKIGEEIVLEGPAQGLLTLDRIPGGKTLWLMGTGSGLSPYLSIIHEEQVFDHFDDVILTVGVRTQEDAQKTRHYLGESFKTLASSNALKILFCVSRDAVEAPFLSGRITECFSKGLLEKLTQASLTPDESRVLLCGNPNFIKSMRALLKERQLVTPRMGKPGQLIVENFWNE